MSANPYQTPAHLPSIDTSGKGGSGGATPMQPLVDVTMWLYIIGWTNIVLGVLYCATIVGLLMGWMPLWIGILAKNAADKLKAGPSQHRGAAKDLATIITIMGVVLLINLAILALYLAFFLLMMLIGVLTAAAGAAGAAASS